MARNVALAGRREIQAQRRFVTGMTASLPTYKIADTAGNKEWVVDVYIGPLESVDEEGKNIIRNVPIAPYAKQLVGDIRQPVLLERSKQGKYTLIGRAKELPAGAQMPDGSILEPTYHLVEHNFADLRLLYVPDLDWTLGTFQATPSTLYQATPETPCQVVRAFDAFGVQVLGPEAEEEPVAEAPAARRVTLVRHLLVMQAKYGPRGDPDAMVWGQSPYQPTIQKIIEIEA
jgi:hypothetical protein